FRTKGTEYETTLGDTELIVKVAKSPLDEELRGVAILSQGVWHETTLAGCERKPFAEYLFGALEVPTLSRDQSAIPAFDMSRSMKLNPRNGIVAEILRFVGVHLETIRKDLERQDRERRKSEEQKRFQQQASKIADLINDHFKNWRAKLRNTMAKAGSGKDLLSVKERKQSDEEGIVPGTELPGIVFRGVGGGDDRGLGPGSSKSRVKLDENAQDKVAKRAAGVTKPTPLGGFSVTFEKIGPNEKRAKYDRDSRTIYINLEHPRIF